eukprot:1109961_1
MAFKDCNQRGRTHNPCTKCIALCFGTVHAIRAAHLQYILNTNFMPRSRPTVGTALLHLQPQTQPNNIHADVGNDAVKTEKPHPGLSANSARSNANTAQQGNTRGKIKFEPGTDEFESAIHWLCDAAKNGKYPSVRYLMGECHIGFSKA